MQPYRYLEEVALKFDQLREHDEIERVLDDLEFLFEAIDPEHQDLCSDLIERLARRLEESS